MTAFLDLFSGIGGFSLGAYWAGLRFDAHYFSEVDPYAIRVYQQRFPGAVPLGDIRNIRGADLPAGDWIIAGGFPCQDISVAGKGAGLAGSRSGLWYEYARLISELRPRYAIMENVGALTFRGLDAVLGSLAEIGYDAEWQDIRASDVGAPHRRERIWIVAYSEVGGSRTFGTEGNEPRRANRASGSGKQLANASDFGRRQGWTRRLDSSRAGEPEQALCNSDLSGLAQRKGEQSNDGAKQPPAIRAGWWSTEPDVGRVAHGVPSRVDRLKCLGNSIVPQIAEMIFSQPAFDEWRE